MQKPTILVLLSYLFYSATAFALNAIYSKIDYDFCSNSSIYAKFISRCLYYRHLFDFSRVATAAR